MTMKQKTPYIEAAKRAQVKTVSNQQPIYAIPNPNMNVGPSVVARHNKESFMVPTITGPSITTKTTTTTSELPTCSTGLSHQRSQDQTAMFRLQNVVSRGSHPTRITMRWEPMNPLTHTVHAQHVPPQHPANLISIPDLNKPNIATAAVSTTTTSKKTQYGNPTFAKMMRAASYVADHPDRFIGDRFLRRMLSDDVYDMEDLLEDCERGVHWRGRGTDVVPKWLVNFVSEYDSQQQHGNRTGGDKPGGGKRETPDKDEKPRSHLSDSSISRSPKAPNARQNLREKLFVQQERDIRQQLTPSAVDRDTSGTGESTDVAKTGQTTIATGSCNTDTTTKDAFAANAESDLNVDVARKFNQEDTKPPKSKADSCQPCTHSSTKDANDADPPDENDNKQAQPNTDDDEDFLDLGDIDLIPEKTMWNLCVGLFPNSRRVRLWRDIDGLDDFLEQLSNGGPPVPPAPQEHTAPPPRPTDVGRESPADSTASSPSIETPVEVTPVGDLTTKDELQLNDHQGCTGASENTSQEATIDVEKEICDDERVDNDEIDAATRNSVKCTQSGPGNRKYVNIFTDHDKGKDRTSPEKGFNTDNNLIETSKTSMNAGPTESLPRESTSERTPTRDVDDTTLAEESNSNAVDKTSLDKCTVRNTNNVSTPHTPVVTSPEADAPSNLGKKSDKQIATIQCVEMEHSYQKSRTPTHAVDRNEVQPNMDRKYPNLDKEQASMDQENPIHDEDQPNLDTEHPNIDTEQPNNIDKQHPKCWSSTPRSVHPQPIIVPPSQSRIAPVSGHVGYEDMPSCSRDFTFGRPVKNDENVSKKSNKGRWKMRLAPSRVMKHVKSSLGFLKSSRRQEKGVKDEDGIGTTIISSSSEDNDEFTSSASKDSIKNSEVTNDTKNVSIPTDTNSSSILPKSKTSMTHRKDDEVCEMGNKEDTDESFKEQQVDGTPDGTPDGAQYQDEQNKLQRVDVSDQIHTLNHDQSTGIFLPIGNSTSDETEQNEHQDALDKEHKVPQIPVTGSRDAASIKTKKIPSNEVITLITAQSYTTRTTDDVQKADAKSVQSVYPASSVTDDGATSRTSLTEESKNDHEECKEKEKVNYNMVSESPVSPGMSNDKRRKSRKKTPDPKRARRSSDRVKKKNKTKACSHGNPSSNPRSDIQKKLKEVDSTTIVQHGGEKPPSDSSSTMNGRNAVVSEDANQTSRMIDDTRHLNIQPIFLQSTTLPTTKGEKRVCIRKSSEICDNTEDLEHVESCDLNETSLRNAAVTTTATATTAIQQSASQLKLSHKHCDAGSGDPEEGTSSLESRRNSNDAGTSCDFINESDDENPASVLAPLTPTKRQRSSSFRKSSDRSPQVISTAGYDDDGEDTEKIDNIREGQKLPSSPTKRQRVSSRIKSSGERTNAGSSSKKCDDAGSRTNGDLKEKNPSSPSLPSPTKRQSSGSRRKSAGISRLSLRSASQRSLRK